MMLKLPARRHNRNLRSTSRVPARRPRPQNHQPRRQSGEAYSGGVEVHEP